jgi:hypothetical protein
MVVDCPMMLYNIYAMLKTTMWTASCKLRARVGSIHFCAPGLVGSPVFAFGIAPFAAQHSPDLVLLTLFPCHGHPFCLFAGGAAAAAGWRTISSQLHERAQAMQLRQTTLFTHAPDQPDTDSGVSPVTSAPHRMQQQSMSCICRNDTAVHATGLPLSHCVDALQQRLGDFDSEVAPEELCSCPSWPFMWHSVQWHALRVVWASSCASHTVASMPTDWQRFVWLAAAGAARTGFHLWLTGHGPWAVCFVYLLHKQALLRLPMFYFSCICFGAAIV